MYEAGRSTLGPASRPLGFFTFYFDYRTSQAQLRANGSERTIIIRIINTHIYQVSSSSLRCLSLDGGQYHNWSHLLISKYPSKFNNSFCTRIQSLFAFVGMAIVSRLESLHYLNLGIPALPYVRHNIYLHVIQYKFVVDNNIVWLILCSTTSRDTKWENYCPQSKLSRFHSSRNITHCLNEDRNTSNLV